MSSLVTHEVHFIAGRPAIVSLSIFCALNRTGLLSHIMLTCPPRPTHPSPFLLAASCCRKDRACAK